MNLKECNEKWQQLIKIFRETQAEGPAQTAKKLEEEIGLADTLTVLATVSYIKKHDGRIYGKEREAMNAHEIAEGADGELREVFFYMKNLDEIHTTHLHQIIREVLYRAERRW